MVNIKKSRKINNNKQWTKDLLNFFLLPYNIKHFTFHMLLTAIEMVISQMALHTFNEEEIVKKRDWSLLWYNFQILKIQNVILAGKLCLHQGKYLWKILYKNTRGKRILLHVTVSIQVCKEWSKNKLQIRSIVNQASWPFQHLNWQLSSGCLWRQIREDGRGDGQMWKLHCWGTIYRNGCFIAIKNQVAFKSFHPWYKQININTLHNF